MKIYNYEIITNSLVEKTPLNESHGLSDHTLPYLLNILQQHGITVENKCQTKFYTHELLMVKALASHNCLYLPVKEDEKRKIYDGVVSLNNNWEFDEDFYMIELKASGFSPESDPCLPANIRQRLKTKLSNSNKKFEARSIPTHKRMIMFDLYHQNLNAENVTECVYDLWSNETKSLFCNLIIRGINYSNVSTDFQINCHF